MSRPIILRTFGTRVHYRIYLDTNKAPCFGQVSVLALRGGCSLTWISELSHNATSHFSADEMPTTKSTKSHLASGAKPVPPTTAKPSKKRKMDANLQKYYAVRAGNIPGVYLTWAECQEQTAGFRGASCTCGNMGKLV
ncbi:hypothetical protein F4802DRAFT_385646 [Xylaria palmicola]|nr:hypothetical protein F4802DRAFT_385646 [Xylaria palmicola]